MLKYNISSVFAILLSLISYSPAQSSSPSSSSLVINQVNFVPPYKSSSFRPEEFDVNGKMRNAVTFSLNFSCPLANVPELSDYCIADGATELTHVDNVTINGKWQINLEPRRLHPYPASGEEFELFARVNFLDPVGKRYSAVAKRPCNFRIDMYYCAGLRTDLYEGDVEGRGWPGD